GAGTPARGRTAGGLDGTHRACRPRPRLPQCATGGGHSRDRGAEHRLCHRGPRAVHRPRRGRARDEGADAGGAAMNYLVFDIETVPDVEYGRRALGLAGLTDAEVATAMTALRREQTGNDFLPLEQQRVVAIACLLRRGETLKLWSLGEPGSGERELLERFFDGIERFTPDLVSWNGSGFDLPVMHYRCMLHGVRAARYWETGDEDAAFRYNNYLGRFHWRHL